MSFAHVVEHMASALAYAKRAAIAKVDLGAFDMAQPFTSSYAAAMSGVQDEERGAILTDVTPDALGVPVRYALLADTSEGDAWMGYLALAARQLSFREMRGQPLPFPSATHCELALAVIDRTGMYESSRYFCSWHPRERRWLTWRQGCPPEHGMLAKRMVLITGAQFTARYEWHADIGLPNAPRVSIPCSAAEARELFAARDLPPGKERRAALLHWVHEHYRRQQGGGAPTVHVREHLRGATEFAWEHLSCTLRPSQFEREQAQRATEPKP